MTPATRNTCPLCGDNIMWYRHLTCPACWTATEEVTPGEYYLDPHTVIELTGKDIERLWLLREERIERHERERVRLDLEQQTRFLAERMEYIEARTSEALPVAARVLKAAKRSEAPEAGEAKVILTKLCSILVATAGPAAQDEASATGGTVGLDAMGTELGSLFG